MTSAAAAEPATTETPTPVSAVASATASEPDALAANATPERILPPHMRPGKYGGALLRGGKPGPRKPGLRYELRRLLTSPACLAAVRRVLEDPDHPHFAALWRTACDRGWGRPEQAIAATIRHPEPLIIRVVHEGEAAIAHTHHLAAQAQDRTAAVTRMLAVDVEDAEDVDDAEQP
jgi:hypothetical protein